MDPAYITTQIWSDLSIVLRFLWLWVLFIVVFAGNMLVAHALIPSLVASEHLPSRMSRLRPFFYAGAAVGAIGAITMIAVAAGWSTVIGDFYSRWWI